jgi:hypothetical protein
MEKIMNVKKVTLSFALGAAILWVLCSALVALFPQHSMQMTAHMIHSDLASTHWAMTWSGFGLGLLGWVVSAGVVGALLAVIYNRLGGNDGS